MEWNTKKQDDMNPQKQERQDNPQPNDSQLEIIQDTSYDESEEEFKMKVNQSFNRLAENKIRLALDELIPHITTSEREKKFVDIFVSKISVEKRFVSNYAEFVIEISKSHPNLTNNIIARAIEKLVDYILNPPNEKDELDCEVSIGYTTFVAVLISKGQIEDGERYLKYMIENINHYIEPPLIEMLKSFVISVGQTFIQYVDKKIFEKLEQLEQRNDIESKVHYLIVDTLKIINGKEE